MAAQYYKLVGTNNPHTNWATSVRFEGDGGEVKTLTAGVPQQLSADERVLVESRGFLLEQSTKAEAEAAQQGVSLVGADIAGSAPVFGAVAVEVEDESESPKGGKK